MIKNLYSVRDNLAEVFMGLYASINHSTAKREFIDTLHKQKGNVSKDDLVLYFMGTYNDNSGQIISCESPEKILMGLELNDNNEGE